MASTTDPSANLSTVRGYTSDLIAVLRHVRGALDQQLSGSALATVPGAEGVIAPAAQTLKAAQTALEARLEASGGLGMAAHLKEAATSITGLLTGLYGQLRGEKASRALRDDHTGLNFVMVCASMLDTTARALGDDQTVRVLQSLMPALAGYIMQVGLLVPQAVVNDLAVDGLRVDPGAAGAAAEALRAAWR